LAVTDHSGTGTSAYYVSYDANGNVSEYIDDSGNTVAHYEYSPFGRLTSATGDKAADFNHRFSTKYQSNTTALYYYGYRYYSAALGRWLSRDPIGERGGLNIYAFVVNGSVNKYDVLGRFAVAPLIGKALLSLVIKTVANAIGYGYVGSKVKEVTEHEPDCPCDPPHTWKTLVKLHEEKKELKVSATKGIWIPGFVTGLKAPVEWDVEKWYECRELPPSPFTIDKITKSTTPWQSVGKFGGIPFYKRYIETEMKKHK